MPPQPYVFISYSHAEPDAEYVDRLAAQLTAASVPVWYDRQFGSGDRWDSELRARVDACAALVVVMSPAAEASPWVQLEVGRARNRRRPVHPILLSGTGFARLADIQYETVPPGETLPSAAFVERLRAALAAPAASPRG